MKRFIVFIAIAAICLGLRFSDNGLLSLGEGNLTVFGDYGSQITIENDDLPLLDRFEGFTRLDTLGDEDDILAALKNASATLLWTENLDDGIIIYYAYAPSINKYEVVHGKKVNIMAALNKNQIAYGCPLLKGSY